MGRHGLAVAPTEPAVERSKASGSARQETKARRKTHAPWISDPYFGFRVVDNVKSRTRMD